MEPTEETDDAVERRYNELCLDLNMDKGTKEEAWESYQKIKTKYTLEVGQFFAYVRYINISTIFFSPFDIKQEEKTGSNGVKFVIKTYSYLLGYIRDHLIPVRISSSVCKMQEIKG